MKKKKLVIKKSIIAKLDSANLKNVKGGIKETDPLHFPCNTFIC